MQVLAWNRCSRGEIFTHCPLCKTVIANNSGQNGTTFKDERCCATDALLLLPVRRSRSKRKRKEKYAIGPCVNNNFI